MKLVLLGFMGSGKSVVGALVAQTLSIPLFEMDNRIVEKSGCSSVQEIFSRYGETHFRALEYEVARETSELDNLVISPGGGVIDYPDTLRALGSTPYITLLLDTSWETICTRLSDDAGKRPLFLDREAAKARYERRRPLYLQHASVTIATDKLTIEAVAQQVIALIKEPRV